MPVQSKHFAARTKHSNALLSPQPYQKTSTNAWSFSEGLGARSRTLSTGDSPTVPPRVSLLRQPAESGNVVRSVQRVLFGTTEVVGCDITNERITHPENDVDVPVPQDELPVACTGYQAKSDLQSPTVGISGAQALQECEEYTDWVNEILSRNKLPLVSDLRKSIGDGYTLPSLIEIIADVSLSCVKTNPTSKEERVLNLIHCLKFLCSRNVDINGIDPKEVEDGNLRAVLLLIGNIRKQFQNTYTPDQNGFSDFTQTGTETSSKTVTQSHLSNMPGTMKLPGAIPTPFISQGQRNNNKHDTAKRKTSYHDDEMLPGVMARETNNLDTTTPKPHFNIISTTEIGTNGVAQHGVDERKHHFANHTSNRSIDHTNNRGMVIRHANARTSLPTSQDQHPTHPPSVTQRAWTASPRQPVNNVVNGTGVNPSVEDRLKNLLGSTSSQSGNRDKMGYFGGEGFRGEGPRGEGIRGEGFHGGGSEILDDDEGEIMIVPPPMSRNSTDFDAAMLGEHNFGPGYRPVTSQHTRQRSQQGYVPSKPSERVQGSRAEVIISRPPSAIAFRTAAPNRTPQAVRSNRENSPYRYDAHTPVNNNNVGSAPHSPDAAYNKPPGPKKAGSNDLRNAWKKLYGPQNPPPYGSNGINRGDQLRSSCGQQSHHRLQNNNQPSVKFAQSAGQMSNRPVSAPAPAHMQAFFQAQEQQLLGQGQSQSQDNLDGGQGQSYNSHQRESPMGQSSSTQGHLDESSSSQQSRLSQEQAQKQLQVQTSTDNNYGKLSHSSQSHSSLSQPSPTSPASPDYAIGPGTKYPDNPGSRPSSARKPTGNGIPQSPNQKNVRPRMPLPTQTNDNVIRNDLRKSAQNLNTSMNDFSERSRHPSGNNQFTEDLKSALSVASREHRTVGRYDFNENHERSHDRSHDLSHDFQNRSIFDYNPPSHSESSGSVTPPLPPLSPTNTPPDSPRTDPTSNLPRSLSATNMPSAMMNEADDTVPMMYASKSRRAAEINMRNNRPYRGKKPRSGKGYKSKGVSDLIRDSCTDTESNLSFDIDDTILTVESHDTEQPHPAGDLHSFRDVREHLNDLEYKYHNIQKTTNDQVHHTHLGPGKGSLGPPPIGRQRRWSIGSSDTSSFRRESKFKPGKQILHKHHSKEFKNINKRFQRLESHVVTLARSVAHLSSELRTHNTMVNDLETIKRELREIRDNPKRPFPNMIDRTLTEQERFRDWVPSLTNPKRVNKLTKFFGTEPPLLELFLEKLGYKRYVSNFQSEHIGMIELPYMTEDRLEKIGVPMGPRIRILQEAQSCFRQENMNVYIV